MDENQGDSADQQENDNDLLQALIEAERGMQIEDDLERRSQASLSSRNSRPRRPRNSSGPHKKLVDSQCSHCGETAMVVTREDIPLAGGTRGERRKQAKGDTGSLRDSVKKLVVALQGDPRPLKVTRIEPRTPLKYHLFAVKSD